MGNSTFEPTVSSSSSCQNYLIRTHSGNRHPNGRQLEFFDLEMNHLEFPTNWRNYQIYAETIHTSHVNSLFVKALHVFFSSSYNLKEDQCSVVLSNKIKNTTADAQCFCHFHMLNVLPVQRHRWLFKVMKNNYSQTSTVYLQCHERQICCKW